jgi:hypothetical protein
MSSRLPRSRALAPACATVIALSSVAAHATEGGGGVYPYGLNTVATGVLPKPGNYVYMYNSYYTADETTTDSGDAAPIDFELDMRVHTLRYLHSFASARLFGGGVGVLVAQPFLVGEVTAGPRSGETDAFGDTTVGVMLGWHRPKAHWMTGVDVTLPTGTYAESRVLNAGRNQWAGTFYGALTAPLGARLDTSLRLNLTVNGPNSATEYESGTEAGLEWSLNCRLAGGWYVGLNGYSVRQVSDDEIHGEAVNGNGKRIEVDAIGPQVFYRGERWGAIGKWQVEGNARNKSEGDKYWLQLFLRL